MFVSRVRPVSEPLRLGRLQGNHFDLVVRDLRPHPAGGTAHRSVCDTPTHLVALVQQAVENVKVDDMRPPTITMNDLLANNVLDFMGQCHRHGNGWMDIRVI